MLELVGLGLGSNQAAPAGASSARRRARSDDNARALCAWCAVRVPSVRVLARAPLAGGLLCE